MFNNNIKNNSNLSIFKLNLNFFSYFLLYKTFKNNQIIIIKIKLIIHNFFKNIIVCKFPNRYVPRLCAQTAKKVWSEARRKNNNK